MRRLRGAGQDVRHAATLLSNFEHTLKGWKDHRDLILATIAALERVRLA